MPVMARELEESGYIKNICYTVFCGTVVVLKLHGCMVACWDDEMDERESMSGYILTLWQRS